MIKYLITVRINDNKVAHIKLLRNFMDVGLADAKRAVEETRGIDSDNYIGVDIDIELIVTELQLGRYAGFYFGVRRDVGDMPCIVKCDPIRQERGRYDLSV